MAPISKPRIVIIGAGMAGLSAAYHLHRHSALENFDLLILEAASRIGGRIFTTSIAGDQVELGATWIHGIEGSPVYEIAKRIGAMEDKKIEKPWERQDGFPQETTFVAEGGIVVPETLVEASIAAYGKAITEVKGRGSWKDNKTHFLEGSVGSFVQEGLGIFMSLQEQSPKDFGLGTGQGLESDWDVRSLQEAVFHMQEDMERIDSACNSLFDQDLDAEKEYEEYPGLHLTIPGGYTSVLWEMANSLPNGTLQLEKKVEKVLWNRSQRFTSPVVICCEDGSFVEADHVILTMSLGVLKTVTPPILDLPSDVCRSVDELRGHLPKERNSCQLFDPALPQWKLQSISRLGFGVVDKLFLEIDCSAEERFRSCIELIHRRGDAAKASTVPWWMRRTFSICPIYQGSLVLVCWFAGAEALEMEGLSDEIIIDGVVETMASFGLHHGLGNVRSDEEEKKSLRKLFRGLLRSTWGLNALCKGSYTYVATGASGMDIDALAEPLPRKSQSQSQSLSMLLSDTYVDGLLPISRSSSASLVSSLSLASSSCASCSSSSDLEEEDLEDFVGLVEEKPLQLLFAGEATHRNLYTTTHGAFLSGAREADRLLQHYGNVK